MILIGDIGGTNARFEIHQEDGRDLCSEERARLASGDYRDAESLFEEALLRTACSERPDLAVVALAGPVRDDHCETTNLPWTVDGRSLEAALGIPRIHFLNDLEAAALGLVHLSESSMVSLQEGRQIPRATRGLISAGTGLGEAGLIWTKEQYRAVATEGGHCTFAPRDDLECELRAWMQLELGGHVSWERVVSGPGLVRLYRFFHHLEGSAEPEELREDLLGWQTPERISRAALEGSCPLAERALDLFCRLYGAESGNFALKLLAQGGIFLGGGIAPEILPFLRRSGFLDSFCDKGRFSEWMRSIPVRVVTEKNLPLHGALERAHETLRST